MGTGCEEMQTVDPSKSSTLTITQSSASLDRVSNGPLWIVEYTMVTFTKSVCTRPVVVGIRHSSVYCMRVTALLEQAKSHLVYMAISPYIMLLMWLIL